MKLWHILLIGGGAWWLLRKKPAVAGPAPVGPTPAAPAAPVVADPSREPTELLDILRTKLNPMSNNMVRTYGSGPLRGNVEIYYGYGTEVFASLPLAMEWAKAQPFSSAPATVNWQYVP